MNSVAVMRQKAKKYIDTADEKVIKMSLAMLKVDPHHGLGNLIIEV